MQNFVFYAIVELGAACPLCLHGSAVKITLCSFWPPDPPKVSQHPTQAEKQQYTTYTISAMKKTMVKITLNSDKRLSS